MLFTLIFMTWLNGVQDTKRVPHLTEERCTTMGRKMAHDYADAHPEGHTMGWTCVVEPVPNS